MCLCNHKILKIMMFVVISLKTRLPVGCEVSGIIQSCGTEVTTLRPGDTVVGIIPMDYGQSGCSEYVVLNEYDVGKFKVTNSLTNMI